MSEREQPQPETGRFYEYVRIFCDALDPLPQEIRNDFDLTVEEIAERLARDNDFIKEINDETLHNKEELREILLRKIENLDK